MTVILLSLIRRKKKWIKIDNKKKTAKRGRVFLFRFLQQAGSAVGGVT